MELMFSLGSLIMLVIHVFILSWYIYDIIDSHLIGFWVRGPSHFNRVCDDNWCSKQCVSAMITTTGDLFLLWLAHLLFCRVVSSNSELLLSG